MQLTCPHCHNTLDYSSTPPSFCGYCGKRLDQKPGFSEKPGFSGPAATQEYVPATATPQPYGGPDAVTVPPLGAAAGTAVELPDVIGGYRLLRQLGGGGMGTVFEAEETTTGRHVALKIIKQHFSGPPEVVTRFKQEGRLASTISHPRCVFVLGADEDQGRPYIVMELMPGDTLNDLVHRRGPLPAEEAITKILDVIEGLQEAHQQGVIHRDVKPSNCFLEAPLTQPSPPGGRGLGEGGRVKIGDFGLAKSLVSDSHLTKTGTFMGTPWFASPEQVKAEQVDQQADVYSVAATLYFLLTGQAPFHSNDAMATLARIVADDPAPMRTLRPELPRSLDKVVLRGLERDRKRRWRNLGELREALVRYLPAQLSAGGVWLRFGAYLLDCLFFAFIVSVVWGLAAILFGVQHRPHQAGFNPWLELVDIGLSWLYFSVPEGLWGWSLGKRVVRLRVTLVEGSGSPGLGRAMLRGAIFFILLNGIAGVAGLAVAVSSERRDSSSAAWREILAWTIQASGLIILLLPMRARNGFRGLHDFVSGTHVVRLPWLPRRRVFTAGARELPLSRPVELPQQIGPYSVKGALCWTPEEKLILAADASLGREVWIRVRPETAPPVSAARKELNRVTRLRWLHGGTGDGQHWNSFLAPSGCVLPVLIAGLGRLAWPETRQLLDDLSEELAAACQDGTLPIALSLNQVWVRPNGHLQLTDMSGSDSANEPIAGSDQERSLGLLRAVAVLALEGEQRPAGQPAGSIRAPVPHHARRLLDRLFGVRGDYQDLAELRGDLAATREAPTEVLRPRRAWHLAAQAACLSIGIIWMLFWGWVFSFGSGVLTQSYVFELEGEQRSLATALQQDLAFGMCQPDPWLRLAGVGQLADTLTFWDRLNDILTRQHVELNARKEATDRMTRVVIRGARLLEDQSRSTAIIRHHSDYAGSMNRVLGDAPPTTESRGALFLLPWIAGLLLMWPALWIFWAYLVRGGISYRFAGIALVRESGMRALRLQCAWRAALAWLPFLACLIAAIVVEDWYWSRWSPGAPLDHIWVLWLSWISWWLAILILPTYVWLALRNPSRGPHDRLAGTYLVPR